jgi:hypothetical protein
MLLLMSSANCKKKGLSFLWTVYQFSATYVLCSLVKILLLHGPVAMLFCAT